MPVEATRYIVGIGLLVTFGSGGAIAFYAPTQFISGWVGIFLAVVLPAVALGVATGGMLAYWFHIGAVTVKDLEQSSKEFRNEIDRNVF